MKKIFFVATAVYLLSLMATLTYAKAGEEYVRWSKGEFEIPAEINEANDITKLQPFLDGKDEFKRMAAVRRLGEVEGEKAVNLLREIFTKEPNAGGLDDFPLVKLEVIRTLGRVDGNEVKPTLFALLNNCWTRGPQVEDKKYFYHDRDFEPVVSLILEELCTWSNDDNVFQTAREIAFGENANNFYSHRIANKAWILYLKGDILRHGIKSEKDSAKYLLDLIKNIEEEGVASSEFGAVKREAAKILFEKHSKEVLSLLKDEFGEEFSKTPRGQGGSFTERHNRLRSQISYIEKVLREKADNEKPAESKENRTEGATK